MKVKQTLLALITLIMATAFFSCSVDLKINECTTAPPAPVKYCFTRGVTTDGKGAGGIHCDSTATGTYVEGTLITLEALPCKESKSSFTGWYDAEENGKLISKEAKYSFKLNAESSLYARFEIVIVKFPDPVLDMAIREYYNLPEGEINKVDVVDRLQFYYSGYGHSYGEHNNVISDLSGLEHLTNLQFLSITHNKVKDISPLRNLTKLDTLYLASNQLTDISPLENLTNLTFLNLASNKQLTDITPLSKMLKLEGLGLDYTSISDITPLSKLTKIVTLSMNYSKVIDIRPLKNMTKLKDISMYNNRISDITPLSNLNSITELNLSNNQIGDIGALKNMTKIHNIKMHNNRISDITPLNSLTSITHIYLGHNRISDITPLSTLTNLATVGMSGNLITDITPFIENPNLDNVKWLYLSGNDIPTEQIVALRKKGAYVAF